MPDSSYFIGRTNYFEKIESAISIEKKKIIILSSVTGSGKTSLANEFGHHFKKKSFNNHYVYWIKSDGKNSDIEFQNFAKNDLMININERKMFEKKFIINEIKKKIQNAQENILFIFDGCDDYLNIKDYVSMVSVINRYTILITTQCSNLIEASIKSHSFENCPNSDETLEICLEPFEENESIEFIMKHPKIKDLKIKNKAEARELVNLLDLPQDLKIRPFVLNKLITYINLKKKPFQLVNGLLENLKQTPKNLKQDILDDTIFKMLTEKKPDAWHILKLSSFMISDFIPVEMYSNFLGLDLVELEKEFKSLQELSLMHQNERNEKVCLQIHKTIQIEVQKYLQSENKLNEVIQIFLDKLVDELLVLEKQNIKILIEKGFSSELYYYNIKEIVKNILKYNKDIRLAYLYGRYLNDVKFNYVEAIEYYLNALSFDNKETSEFANILHYTGFAYGNSGNSEKAIEYYKKSLEIKKILYKNDGHESIADTLNNIGLLNNQKGNYQEALSYFQDAFQIKQKLQSHDISLSKIINNIGFAHSQLGEYEKALCYYEDSIKIKRDILQTDVDPSVVNTLENIGLCKQNMGRYKEALEYYEKSLKIQNSLYENLENESIANTLVNIGCVYNLLNESEKALEYSNKCLEICDKIQQSHNIKSIKAEVLNNLGSIFNASKESTKALDYCEKSLLISLEIFQNEDNYNIGEIMNNLGLINFNLGNFQKAEEYYSKSLRIYTIVFENKQNLKLLKLYENMSMYYKHFKNEEFSEFSNKALEIRKFFKSD